MSPVRNMTFPIPGEESYMMFPSPEEYAAVACLEESWSDTLLQVVPEGPPPAYQNLPSIQSGKHATTPRISSSPNPESKDRSPSTHRSNRLGRLLSSKRKKGSKPTTVPSKISSEPPPHCTVNHAFYCPSQMAAGSLFFDYKVATHFAHLAESRTPSGMERRTGRGSAAGDFNVLKERKERRWNDWQRGLDGMKEPRDAWEGAVGIFSVLDDLESEMSSVSLRW